MIDWNKRSNAGGGSLAGMVSVSVHNSSAGVPYCRIGISKEAMTAASLKLGDRMRVGFDREARVMVINRPDEPDNGCCTLCPSSGKLTDNMGMVATACAQFTLERRFVALIPKSLARCVWRPEMGGLVVSLPYV